jgi:hypothetical protein
LQEESGARYSGRPSVREGENGADPSRKQDRRNNRGKNPDHGSASREHAESTIAVSYGKSRNSKAAALLKSTLVAARNPSACTNGTGPARLREKTKKSKP